jgi:Zn-dependent protease with chaperone function/Tfp pilus assembly protein PilE
MKELTISNLTLQKEKKYFWTVFAFSLAIWAMVVASVVGFVIALAVAVFLWFANGLFVAKLKSDCVLIDQGQLPDLYETYLSVCRRLEITRFPQLYVLESGGILNAVSLRHAGRNFVVIHSDALEAFGAQSDEIKFLIGHELGHIKSQHILKEIMLAPGMFIPLIGPAYSRACEASCDRHGVFASENIDSAIRAMMVFSGGREAGKMMSPEAFSRQHALERGFFISWYELVSGYPTACQRVALLQELEADKSYRRQKRHPLSYFFALFSFGGHASGAGNFVVTVLIVGIAAAIVMPKIFKSRIERHNEQAQENLVVMAGAVEDYLGSHDGKYPTDMAQVFDRDSSHENLCDDTLNGFHYSCFFYEDNFELTATPVEPNNPGVETYLMNREGLMILNGTDVEFVDGDEPADPSDSEPVGNMIEENPE